MSSLVSLRDLSKLYGFARTLVYYWEKKNQNNFASLLVGESSKKLVDKLKFDEWYKANKPVKRRKKSMPLLRGYNPCDFLTISQFAERYDIAYKTVRSWISYDKTGFKNFLKVGEDHHGKVMIISIEDADKFYAAYHERYHKGRTYGPNVLTIKIEK